MMALWIILIPRLIGAVLCYYSWKFVPRNLLSVIWNHKIHGARRRIFTGCWLVIITGYAIAGTALSIWGWNGLRAAGFSFAAAMISFVPLPCHISAVRRNWQCRFIRNTGLIIAAAISVWVALM